MAITFTERPELVSRGRLLTFEIAMRPIPDGRMRTIRVWLPEEYDGARRFPVLYLHDGNMVFPPQDSPANMGSWEVDRRVSELPEELHCIVVGVDTSDDRACELLPPYKRNPAHRIPRAPGMPPVVALGGYYADFVRDTLKPVIDANFMTLPDAAHTGIGGASMGGLMALYMTLRDPDVFGRSLVLSPGLDILHEDCLELIDAYDPARLADVRIYMYSGDQTFDVTIAPAAMTVYRRIKDSLKIDAKRLCLVIDSRESHWGRSWSKYTPDGLRYLFSEDNGVVVPQMGFIPREEKVPE
jgi:predicted alpha/beta superfamily hydrolase